MYRSKRCLCVVVGLVLGGCAGPPEKAPIEAPGVAPATTGVILPALPEVNPATAAPGTILLPIEVGASTQTALYPATDADKAEVGVSFDAPLPADGSLLIVGHELGYRDGHEVADGTGAMQLVKGGKASVRLGDDTANPDCAWIALANDNTAVHVRAPDKLYGGIGGGFSTVRLTVDLSAFGAACLASLSSPTTTVRFRFNGTDGVSSGYRILYFNVLDTAENHLITNPMAFVDPDVWTAPAGGNAATGASLWSRRESLTSPTPSGPTPIVAACSDCHARDARDLEYYAYSNQTIINRAMFHGLSVTDGKDIAAYVRSNAALRHGRPWNPPYQPGTYVDSSGVSHEYDVATDSEYWAAGAGLGAVLDDEVSGDAVVLQRLLGISCSGAAGCSTITPGGDVTETIADAIRGTGLDARTTNLRRIPIALQLPDWNHWLPEHHPLDMWGKEYWLGPAAVASPVQYLVSDDANVVVVGDINGDQVRDLVTAAHGTLTILQGDGYGRFEALPSIAVGSDITSVALGDFDGNGSKDIVAADSAGGSVNLLFQQADGTFNARSFAVVAPRAVGAGDFDADGYDDLAVTTDSGDIRFYRSPGANVAAIGFTLMGTTHVGGSPAHLAVADVNEDGLADVAVSNQTSGDVTVFEAVAGGGVIVQPPIAVGNGPAGITAADVDGDGHLDLAVVAENDDALRVLVANAAGGFAAPITVPVGDAPTSVAAGDVDGDDDVDLVVGNFADGTLSVALTSKNMGGGVSFATYPLTVDGKPRAVAVGDFDVNGTADVAVGYQSAASGITVRLSTQRPNTAYDEIRSALSSNPPVGTVQQELDRLMVSAQSFVGTGMWPVLGAGSLSDGWRGDRGPVIDDAARNGFEHEMVKRDLAQWVAVKYWEMMHEFDLEGRGPDLHGSDGEALSWPMIEQAVHPIAPHITTLNSNNFRSRAQIAAANPLVDACSDPGVTCPPDINARQEPVKGDYDSSVWYHLQLLLNAGARNVQPYNMWAAKPWDIGYAYIHIDDVARAASAYAGVSGNDMPFESLRYVATMMKAYQMRNNGRGPAQAGWSMRDVSPRLLVSNFDGDADKDDLMARLELHGAGLRLAVTNAFLKVFLEVVSADGYLPPSGSGPEYYTAAERCGGSPQPTTMEDVLLACDREPTVRDTWWRLDPAIYKVTLTNSLMTTYAADVPAGTQTWQSYLPTVLSAAEIAEHGYTPERLDNEFSSGKLHHADDIYRTLPIFRHMGVTQGNLCGLIAWARLQWPGPAGDRNNWEDFSPAVGCP